MKRTFTTTIFLLISILSFIPINAQEKNDFVVGAKADFVSRYIWRGLLLSDAPAIQPALTFGMYGIELGTWGSYSFANNQQATDEVDFWLSFTHQFKRSIGISVIFLDYYLPNAGVKFGNVNNYNDPAGPGAHLLEAGLILFGPESLPITVSGYVNFYNDPGKNKYFQVDYTAEVKKTNLMFFVGATAGSKNNPSYYGSEKFNVINVGVNASKEIKITEDFSLPVFVEWSVNPRQDISFVRFGLTLQ
ncbi:MAG: hypothetical protein K9J16_12930 [Melioribacteraceae bacterium]|nr:hypothetical protein [Melioribacteraceae bacterium]MCF8353653.1 hypothetical protein [Melioribacteraceae bacterium]MCF8393423.1 hypothetical protein [Melioribacteraceae bacterium]MCF8419280.1 hypothetical protein [Melioribacteraceae bacterium]